MSQDILLAVDQGTSGTKAVLFDDTGRLLAKATAPLASSYPRPGFVEQAPDEIYRNVLQAVRDCLAVFDGDPRRIVACGLSNQRETFCLWDDQGRPLAPAVVWQCKRSVDLCRRLADSDLAALLQQRTGLIVDPYFSGSKVLWLYENDADVRAAIDAGRAHFGTVDTWLLYRLTGGRRYQTDVTNACRTWFLDIETLDWDRQVLECLGLSGLRLPEVRPCGHDFGKTDFEGLLPAPIRITAMMGDSHAAAFGEGCRQRGTAKATLGTGCSILLNTASEPVRSSQGMVTTLCWATADRVDYALEGIIVTCGATLTWLRDQLGLFADSAETESLARSVPDNQGVVLVPAFSGLGAPHWRMDLQAAVFGLSFGCDRRHLVRAALESIGFQIRDVITAMKRDSQVELASLRVDGGITANGFVMQFLTDLLQAPVVNLGLQDVSALGAALMAGLQAGVFADLEALDRLALQQRTFHPGSPADRFQATEAYGRWCRAVSRLTQTEVSP